MTAPRRNKDTPSDRRDGAEQTPVGAAPVSETNPVPPALAGSGPHLSTPPTDADGPHLVTATHAPSDAKSVSSEQSHKPADDNDSAVEEAFEEISDAVTGAGRFSAGVVQSVVVGVFAYLGAIASLLAETVSSLRRGVNAGDLIRQMLVIGVESIPIELLTVGFSGAVLALYTSDILIRYGASGLVGGIVSISIIKETGPLLTGISLAARAGSAMTAEIGSMKVSEQIDALRTMAISPAEYLVAPRLLACLIMAPIVSIFADFAGIIGGGVVAVLRGVPSQSYLLSIRQLLEPSGSDVFKSLLKAVIFGVIIALVGCREGLNTEGGATGVGQATTRSVVLSIILVFAADLLLSFLMFQKLV